MPSIFPALFIGHGSPMNIIQDNDFTRSLEQLCKTLPLPDAILVISAHWQTHGTQLTCGKDLPQIYDFYGFPDSLYKIKYTPPAAPVFAKKIVSRFPEIISCHDSRGLDHAAWAVLHHLYPEANIPVLELSLDREKTPAQHYQLGQKLASLREKNILMIGSGNMVHNLGKISFETDAAPFEWAVDFDALLEKLLVENQHQALIDYPNLGAYSQWAIPTNEHYLPLLYILGMQTPDEPLTFFHQSIQNGSISMRSFQLG